MYDSTDPRSVLQNTARKANAAPLPAADAEYGLFYQEPPADDDANGKTWFARGQNFIVAYSELKPGATFQRHGQPDEFVVILENAGTPVIASAGGQEERSEGNSLIIMPPGDSRLYFPDGGRVVRLFTTRSDDLNAKCSNNEAYANPHPNIPPLESWPEPVGGFKIRVYSLDVPPEEGRLGRIWRCTTFMINMPYRQSGGRDLSKLSPHFHDDFEQCSLALAGTWTHHMRWPWSVNYQYWREDVHAVVQSPSITVIPPPVVHTSVCGEGENQLVDIFAPPRVDFSNRPGWVLNAEDYPMPEMAD